MSVEFNLANLIFVAIALFSGGWALLKIIAIQFERGLKRDLQEQFRIQEVTAKARAQHVDTRLDAMDSALKADASQWQRVERELLNLKADMPLHYVRREDYIRGQSVLEAKQDALYSRIELLQNQITVLINKGVSHHG